MPKPITEGAQMKCDKGTNPSQIKVTSQNHTTIKCKLQATSTDIFAQENIPSFGKCLVTRNQCIPHAIKWKNTTQFSAIDGQEELTIVSTCKCSLGGSISFIAEQTNSFVDNTDENENQQHDIADSSSSSEQAQKEKPTFTTDEIIICLFVLAIMFVTIACVIITRTSTTS